MVTTRWELKFQKRPERPTSALGGIFMGYLLDLSETAGTGCDCTEQEIKRYLWGRDWGANPGVSRVGVKCISSWAKFVTSALIEVNPGN